MVLRSDLLRQSYPCNSHVMRSSSRMCLGRLGLVFLCFGEWGMMLVRFKRFVLLRIFVNQSCDGPKVAIESCSCTYIIYSKQKK